MPAAQLETVPIARIADTTTPTGTCNAGTCAQFDADVPVAVTVAGTGGVPASGAVAVVGTITVTDPDGDGWLNVNPNGDAAAAVIALRDATTAATGFTAQLDTNGTINLLATADVDVAIDITGYYRAPDPWVPALNYWPTGAVLAADSATGTGTCDGVTCGTLTAGEHDVVVAGVGAVPASDVAAVTVSISTGTTGAAGTLRAAPNGAASAGSLEWDTTFPNAAGQFTVPVNGDGTITVEVDTATDIRVSVTGWWATPDSATDAGTGLVLVDDGPVRLVDTAEGIGSCDGVDCATLVGNDPPVQVDVADAEEIDLEDIVAVMVSVTVHDPTGPGLVGLGMNATDLSALMVFDDTAHTAAIIPVDAETGTISMASWTNVDVTIDVIGGFTRPTTTYRYEYDSAGLRTAKEREGTGGWRDEFTWTAHGGLPLLLAEHRGSDTSYLVYGPGGTPIYQVTKTGSVMYFHQDHLGSTRLVTNANGTVRGTLDYDTYGQITANTVPWLYEQPLATYTGEYTDTETGFIYLRARHYDPATGQFTTRDLIVAITEEPYGYTNGNPANGADPTGLMCIGDVCADDMVEGLDWFGGKVKEGWDATGGKAISEANDHKVGLLKTLGVGLTVASIPATGTAAAALAVGGAVAMIAAEAVDPKPGRAQRVTAAIILAGWAGGISGLFDEGGLPIAGMILDGGMISLDVLSADAFASLSTDLLSVGEC